MIPSHVENFSVFLLVLFSVVHSQNRCPIGTFSRRSDCLKCPLGTFQNETGATSCQPCPAGHYNPILGIQGIDLCRPCPIGTFNPNSGAVSIEACRKCPPGTNAQEGAPKCISCPRGSIIRNCPSVLKLDGVFDFRGTCFDCFFGNLGSSCGPAVPVEPLCERCNANFFPPFSRLNALFCENCPEGTFFDATSTRCRTGPTSCPPGRVLAEGRCQKCRSFEFNDGTFEGCKNCPPGSQGNTRSGSTRCLPCPPGTAKRDVQSSRCRPCRDGENSFVTGSRYCFRDDLQECPPGFFKGNGGACLRCTLFEQFDPETKTCVSCPTGSLSEGGLSETCKKCGRGMTTSPDYNRCVCSPGFGFVLGSNGRKCEKCAAGSANDNPSSTCDVCSANTFAPRAGLSQCMPCPEGMEQPKPGQKKCVPKTPCERGLIENEFQGCVEPETGCPPNFRRIEVSGMLPTCEPLSGDVCPAGTVAIFEEPFRITKQCSSCFSSTRYDPRSMTCEQCEPDEISTSGLSQECIKCENGTTSFGRECRCANGRQFVNGQCVQCPRGTFGFNRIDGCMACPAGTSSNGQVLESCQQCRAGTFTDGPGQGRCKPCPRGTTSFGFGETGCVTK